MTTCVCFEGISRCSYWWAEQCNNPFVPKETKDKCKGILPRLEKEEKK